MTRIRTKLLVAGVILTAAVGYLAYAGVKSGWAYFIDVDSFLADPQYRGQRVRLHGTVRTDGLEIAPVRLLAKFQLAGKHGVLPVVYHGSIPDLFGGGKNVVIEGQCDPSGLFQADLLMTKCASKYEAGSPHAEKKS